MKTAQLQQNKGNIGNPTLIRSAFDPFIHCDEVGTQEVNEMISTTAPRPPGIHTLNPLIQSFSSEESHLAYLRLSEALSPKSETLNPES